MIPWIQIYSNLPQHRKTSKLAEELKISSAIVDPNTIAVGLLVGLWTWAIQNAYDGNLSECSPRTIANACQWKKKPETLVQALIKTGWLDDDMQLHDWEEYAVLLIDQEENRKEKTRERVRKHREKKMQGLVCAYCGDRATGYDHIIPVSKGGTDDPNNLVPCCPDCNREKNNRPLADFLNTSRKMKREIVEQNKQIMQYVTFEQGRYVSQCVTLRNASTIHNHTKPNIVTDSTTDVVKSVTKLVAAPPPKEQTGFSPKLQAAFESWLRYKKQRRDGYQDEGLKALIGRIRNCSAQYGEDAVAQVITDSMSSGYKGILFDRLPNYKRQMVQTAQTGRDIAAEVEESADWMRAYLAGEMG